MAFNRYPDLIHEDILMEMKSELYDFQKETVEAAMDKIFSSDRYIGKIILPTGAGKTKIAEYLTARLINEIYKGNHKRPSVCGVACHRLILANNLLERILNTLAEKIGLKNIDLVIVNSGNYNKFVNDYEETYGIKLNIKNANNYSKEGMNGFLQAAQKQNRHVFFVMLYHSMDRVIDLGINFDFVFCDEAHTTIEKQHYDRMEQFVKQCDVVLHMTATPTTNATGKDMTNTEVYGDIVIEKQPRELVFGKHICPINLILHETFDKAGLIKTRNDIFTNTGAVINSIMTAADSLFTKVKQNQENANIPENEQKQGVLFVSVNGNKHLTEIIECRKKNQGQKFAAWREKNDVDLYIISAEKGGWIDYPETKQIGDAIDLNKEDFLNAMEKINKERKNKSIIIFIDMLAEGVDLPDINGVLLLRALDDNAAKIMQIIGRAVRRDNNDRKLINDDSVQFNDYDKFQKPCAYVYLPTAVYSRNESENIMNTMLKLYDAYGDIVFYMATRETQEGDSSKLIENPTFMKKCVNPDEISDNYSLNVEKAKEIIINLMSNIEISYDEKIQYITAWMSNHWEELKNTDEKDNEFAQYAAKINYNVNLFYDYIKVID
jgi:superfamily II DNA or RNA helicase